MPSRMKRTGITKDQVDERLAQQGGTCAICDTTAPGLHGWLADSLLGYLVGVLCRRCMSGMHMLYGDPNLLRRAADYVDATQTEIERAEWHRLTS